MKCYVLIKTQDGEIQKIMGVYASMQALEDRVKRIDSANPQYPMVKHSPIWWSIGPQEDEGFFGNPRYDLLVIESNFYGETSE